jgi:hypothetical protein
VRKKKKEDAEIEKSEIKTNLDEFSKQHTAFMEYIDSQLNQNKKDNNLASKRLGYSQNYAIQTVNAIGTFMTRNNDETQLTYEQLVNASNYKPEFGGYIILLNKLNASEKQLLRAFLVIKTPDGIEYAVDLLSKTLGLKLKDDARFKNNLKRFIKLPQNIKNEIISFNLSGGKRKSLKQKNKRRKTKKQRKNKRCKITRKMYKRK